MSRKADQVLPIRLPSETVDKLDRLVAAIPGAKRSSLARAILERALADIADDPVKLLRPVQRVDRKAP